MRNLPAILMVLLCASRGDARPAPSPEVRPIDWSRFGAAVKPSPERQQAERVLLNSVRYCMKWAPGVLKQARTREPAAMGFREQHDLFIRPMVSAAWASAVALKTGLLQRAGDPGEESVKRMVLEMIRFAASAYDHGGKKSWGLEFRTDRADCHQQAGLWATWLGSAAWLIWEEVDADTRAVIRALMEHEADQFLTPGFKVPYWNGRGGDSKGEENAWNGMFLATAVAMMPDHPRAIRWKTAASELMASSYATKADLADPSLVDGKPLRHWLKGYNANEDGLIANHQISPHIHYSFSIRLKLRSVLAQSLAGQPISETADLHAARMYRTINTKAWDSPPYEAPGGTVYVPGKAEVYFPKGDDKTPSKIDNFYATDVFAHVLKLDDGLPIKAQAWLKLRGERLLEMQSRHEDGRLFAGRENGGKPYWEPQAAAGFADAVLLLWLQQHKTISPKKNWLAS